MKMIYKTIALCLVAILHACSPSDNELTKENEKAVEIDAKTSKEEDAPFSYIEELHYMYILTEFGEDHELIAIYRERFEEIAAGVKPGSGCPMPQPCDLVGNCKALVYEYLEGFMSLSEMGGVDIGIYNYEGQPINAINIAEVVKCPTKKSALYKFEEPLEGDGYFVISFVSEFTEEAVEFQIPFMQQ